MLEGGGWLRGLPGKVAKVVFLGLLAGLLGGFAKGGRRGFPGELTWGRQRGCHTCEICQSSNYKRSMHAALSKRSMA